MAKFSQILKGTRARHVVPFPISAAPVTEGAERETVPVDVRVLSGIELATCLEKARERAAAKGITDPAQGEPIYDLALMVETLAVAVVDHESPEDAPAPFFDGGAEQILADVDSERISYLYAWHEMWQSMCSPRLEKLDEQAAFQKLIELTTRTDPGPFVEMLPATAWALLRFTGGLLLSSPELRSQLSSLSSGKKTTGAPSFAKH